MDTTESSNYFGEQSSLATNHNTKIFGPSATPMNASQRYGGYSFIALLGLAQRLRIPFLPITWQAPLGFIGKGGQARINQAVITIQISFAFKNFEYLPQDPFREAIQEMVVLSHQAIREHKHVVRLEGICWNVRSSVQVRPVLVFQKTDLGDLHKFAMSEKFKSLSIEEKINLCVDVGIAVRDMHCNGTGPGRESRPYLIRQQASFMVTLNPQMCWYSRKSFGLWPKWLTLDLLRAFKASTICFQYQYPILGMHQNTPTVLSGLKLPRRWTSIRSPCCVLGFYLKLDPLAVCHYLQIQNWKRAKFSLLSHVNRKRTCFSFGRKTATTGG